jgi:hypothetical protein
MVTKQMNNYKNNDMYKGNIECEHLFFKCIHLFFK